MVHLRILFVHFDKETTKEEINIAMKKASETSHEGNT